MSDRPEPPEPENRDLPPPTPRGSADIGPSVSGAGAATPPHDPADDPRRTDGSRPSERPRVTAAPPPRPAPASAAGVRPRSPAAVTRRGTSPVAAAALFLAVLEAAALGALWAHPRLPADLQSRLDQLTAEARHAENEAGAVSDTVATLRNELATQAAALAGVQRIVDALQAHPASDAAAPAGAAAAPPEQATLAAGDLAALRDELAAARDESRNAVASLASLERADIASVRSATSAAIDGFGARLNTLGSRLDQQAQAGSRAEAVAERAERLARLQAAMVALADGRPLGAIPNAPPAVADFADRSPPTLASLVLSFPDAAHATLRASEPQTSGLGFFRRLWVRTEAAVTVREGNRVIVGDPAAGILAAARQRLAAGDLAGTVATLGELNGAAADAMDPWRSRAASLVDARAALASMMAHS